MVGAIIGDIAGSAYEHTYEHGGAARALRTGAPQIGPDHRVRVRVHVATRKLRRIIPRVDVCRGSKMLPELWEFERRRRDV